MRMGQKICVTILAPPNASSGDTQLIKHITHNSMTVTEIVADEVEFVGTKRTEETGEEEKPELTPVEVDDNSLPF